MAGQWTLACIVPSCVRFNLMNCKFTNNLLVETITVLARPTSLDIGNFFPTRQSGDPIDITESLSQVLGTGLLENLRISSRPSSFELDVGALVSALLQDTTLRSLEFQQAPSSRVQEHRLSKHLLTFLKRNSMLEQLIVYGRVKGSSKYVDYTGFSTVTHSTKPWRGIRCRSPPQRDVQKMAYYMRLNKFGRRKVGTESTTVEDFIALLDAAKTELMHNNQLDYFNVVFGLLLEYEPNKWLPGIRVDKLPQIGEMREPSREPSEPSSRNHPAVLSIQNAFLCYP
jgi:hypothetical protein